MKIIEGIFWRGLNSAIERERVARYVIGRFGDFLSNYSKHI
jgi:hypothetical protein